MKLFVAALAVLSLANLAEQPSRVPPIKTQADLSWSDAPPWMPPGAKMAVLYGNPRAGGMFVVRILTPAGYQAPARAFAGDLVLTVLQGELAIGFGAAFDQEKLRPVVAGGVVSIPARQSHFIRSTTESIIQLSGNGPL